ncbi:hypothetical protein, partial [Bradyrhizobium sp.]|uniref:hypothetical protein n=1 Tax=Bradyrhizobium sp. TaxID=376 RepID=UPI003C753C0F
QYPADAIGRRTRRQRGHHRDRHAGHAEEVAPAARCRAGQPAQLQDEKDACDQIQQRGEIGVHARTPSRAGSIRASI